MSDLLQTDLYEFHRDAGAKMVPFAGYEMPVQYPLGVMKEHVHTRTACGLFDVSHMGQVRLIPRSGGVQAAALALESLVPVDILSLPEGRQRYGFFTNDSGGILDDLMISNRGDHLFLVVNAACKAADIAHLRTHISEQCDIIEDTDRALLALQGPKTADALAAFAPEVADMRFMDVADISINGTACLVSRSGYTGEDGFEISVPGSEAASLAQALIAMEMVEPIGLGARDSLRLEAGLCLYGNDIDQSTTPVEAGLTWAIQSARRPGGDRAGGYPGADVVADHLGGAATRCRVGLSPEGRAPIRGGTEIFAHESADTPIGAVTSGGFGPTVQGPVAMGYVTTEHAAIGTTVFAELRGKRLPVTVTKLPFITPGYKRN